MKLREGEGWEDIDKGWRIKKKRGGKEQKKNEKTIKKI